MDYLRMLTELPSKLKKKMIEIFWIETYQIENLYFKFVQKGYF